jgi:hypothetical protein
MSRSVTVAGYVVLILAVVGYQLLGLVHRRMATLGQTLRALKTSPVGRLVLAAGWMWIGWHLFVRASWR